MATISSLLADHVSLQVRSVDRLFLQGYVPRLMTEGQVIRFLLDRGFPIPSPAVLGKIGRGYVDQINEFIARNEIPTVKFVKGDVKEEIARKHFATAESEGRYGVVMVGIAQEKTSAWRGWRDGGPDGHPHFVYRRQSIFPNNYYYYYIRDPDSVRQPGLKSRRRSASMPTSRRRSFLPCLTRIEPRRWSRSVSVSESAS